MLLSYFSPDTAELLYPVLLSLKQQSMVFQTNVPKFSHFASHPPPEEISAVLTLTHSLPDFCYAEQKTIQPINLSPQ